MKNLKNYRIYYPKAHIGYVPHISKHSDIIMQIKERRIEACRSIATNQTSQSEADSKKMWRTLFEKINKM